MRVHNPNWQLAAYKKTSQVYEFKNIPALAGASLGGVGSVGVVLLVLGLSSFT